MAAGSVAVGALMAVFGTGVPPTGGFPPGGPLVACQLRRHGDLKARRSVQREAFVRGGGDGEVARVADLICRLDGVRHTLDCGQGQLAGGIAGRATDGRGQRSGTLRAVERRRYRHFKHGLCAFRDDPALVGGRGDGEVARVTLGVLRLDGVRDTLDRGQGQRAGGLARRVTDARGQRSRFRIRDLVAGLEVGVLEQEVLLVPGQRAVSLVVREVRREACPRVDLDRHERIVLRARGVTDGQLVVRRCHRQCEREHHRRRGEESQEPAHSSFPSVWPQWPNL